MTSDAPAGWDPAQYRRFAEQRSEPFHDLLAVLQPARIRRAVDLGCGPGELTALARRTLDIDEIVGIDHDPAMLAAAAEHAGPGVRFEPGDIAAWTAPADHDLVLAAASLQWVPDHAAVLARWTNALAPGGQLAVQVPDNADQPTHTVAAALAEREPYRSAFGSAGPPPDPVRHHVLRPEEYASLLWDLGYVTQTVRLHVYPHVLPSSRHVVEWVRGTTLTRFRRTLPADLYERFLVDYERELLAVLGRREPHFFPFRRILLLARRPG
ncbi:MAG: methyltransferase domain-containing protein [Ilumatobacteraceae bacterium]|nr:methyltransferase domain-containing protein [Ilumatobacteraceae bacterium]